MIYFGCYGEPGHAFFQSGPYGPQGLPRVQRETLPWTASECDGNLQPGTAELKSPHKWKRSERQVEGVCRLHRRQGWTAMAFWDRSGDRRGNSCSVVMTDREYNFAEMVDAFRIEFPGIHARCTAKFDLVEER